MFGGQVYRLLWVMENVFNLGNPLLPKEVPLCRWTSVRVTVRVKYVKKYLILGKSTLLLYGLVTLP